MKLRVALLLGLLSALAMGQQNALVVQQQFSAAGTSAWLPVAGYTNFTLTWSQVGATSVTGCQVQVDSSPVGSGSGTAGGLISSQSCNTNGTVTVASESASFSRINVTGITAGTIKITYSAVNGALSKGGSGSYTGSPPIVVSGNTISCPTCGGGIPYPGAGIPVSVLGTSWGTSLTEFGSEAGLATAADPGATLNVPMVADGSHGIKPSPSGALNTGAFAAVPTASSITTLLQGLTGCNTASYVYTPQASDCVAQTGGANTALSNLATVAINTSLLPASSGSANIGSAALPFGIGFFNTQVDVSTSGIFSFGNPADAQMSYYSAGLLGSPGIAFGAGSVVGDYSAGVVATVFCLTPAHCITSWPSSGGNFSATITSPVASQTLQYNGTAWVNVTPGVPVDTSNTATIPATDNASLIASSTLTTLAGTNILTNGFVFSYLNLNSAGVTYTPLSGVIYPGSGSTQLVPSDWFALAYTNGTNTYMPVLPTIKAFADTSAGGLAETYNATTGAFGTIAVSSGNIPFDSQTGHLAQPTGAGSFTYPQASAGLTLAGTTPTTAGTSAPSILTVTGPNGANYTGLSSGGNGSSINFTTGSGGTSNPSAGTASAGNFIVTLGSKGGSGSGGGTYGTANIQGASGSNGLNLVNTTTSAIANSLTQNFMGQYEATSGPTYALDTWSVQSVLGSGVNGTSYLTYLHAGTSGTSGLLANEYCINTSSPSCITSWPSAYTLPAATSSTLGGVKPDGTSILNTAGAISVTPASVGAEPALGNPGTNGYVLSSTTAGTRSWIAPAGDTITSPNSTLNVGGTTSATTLDIAGAAGEIMAGATPALTYTPALGKSGTAGTLSLFPATGNFTTTLGSAATASNTVNFFASVPTTLHTFYCVVSSTTCTLTDSGYAYNSIPFADLSGVAPSFGSVTQYGIAYGSSSTAVSTTGALTANALIKAGSSAAPSASSVIDNASTVTTTDTGGFVGPVFTANGTTAGFIDLPQGSTSAAVAPCNTANSHCIQAGTAVTAGVETDAPALAQGIPTRTGSSSAVTDGYSGDANHSATVSWSTATSVGSTSLCSSANCPAGTYRVSAYMDVTTACTTTGSYVVNLIWTDDTTVSKTSVMPLVGLGVTPTFGPTAITATLVPTSTTDFGTASFILRSTGTTSINYSTTAGACGTGGPGVGKLYLTVEPIQ